MYKDSYKELETLEDGNIRTYEEYMEKLDHMEKTADNILNNTGINDNYEIDEIVDAMVSTYKNEI